MADSKHTFYFCHLNLFCFTLCKRNFFLFFFFFFLFNLRLCFFGLCSESSVPNSVPAALLARAPAQTLRVRPEPDRSSGSSVWEGGRDKKGGGKRRREKVRVRFFGRKSRRWRFPLFLHSPPSPVKECKMCAKFSAATSDSFFLSFFFLFSYRVASTVLQCLTLTLLQSETHTVCVHGNSAHGSWRSRFVRSLRQKAVEWRRARLAEWLAETGRNVSVRTEVSVSCSVVRGPGLCMCVCVLHRAVQG